jgi:hypothetical protein
MALPNAGYRPQLKLKSEILNKFKFPLISYKRRTVAGDQVKDQGAILPDYLSLLAITSSF